MNKKLIIGLLSSTVVISGFLFAAWGSDASLTANPKRKISSEHKSDNKMKVEIWSDVMCPFCYIGKKKFETAWNEFAAKNKVEIEWKSFQIMPGLQTQPDRSIHEVLVDQKRISLEQAKQLNGYATQMAKDVGLTYNFDKTVPVNTLKAHQFQHFAKANGKGVEAEELMFKAYFTDGKNIDDMDTLVELGKSIGLDGSALKSALEKQTYLNAIKNEIQEADKIGVNGVPFFVFNRKRAVSGAQDPQVFLDMLQKSFEEWRNENPQTKLEVVEGAVCKPDGTCDQ
ncbi:DsbA family oxidoreductase [Sphingobacterium faecium]|uniref:DsbA family oxidoreductase n=1 Tax=Sphingobacterium faecium TaxID=34087 RepID=UPI003DA68ABC